MGGEAFVGMTIQMIVLLSSLCACLLAIVLFIVIGRNRRLKQDNYNLKLQQIFLASHRQALEHQIALSQELKSEMTHHMERMNALTASRDSQEIEKYEQELRELYQTLQQVDYCDNIMIDAVIQSKSKECKAKGIRFDAEMNNLQNHGIQDFDLLQLFHICLQIAIRACEDETATDNYILLRCQNIAGFLMIQVKYSCHQASIITPEIEKLAVMDCVRKYDGEIKETSEKQERTLTIMLNQGGYDPTKENANNE